MQVSVDVPSDSNLTGLTVRIPDLECNLFFEGVQRSKPRVELVAVEVNMVYHLQHIADGEDSIWCLRFL